MYIICFKVCLECQVNDKVLLSMLNQGCLTFSVQPFICHLSASSLRSTVQFKCPLLHFLKILFIVFQTFLRLGSLNKKYLVMNESIHLCPKLCNMPPIVLYRIIIFKFVYVISVFKVVKIFLPEIATMCEVILFTISAYKFGVYCMYEYGILFAPSFQGN
jgi:hypothetical protein